MPKYRVIASVTGSKYIGEFEAATPDEAVAMAEDVADVSLCHQCSGECEDPEIRELHVEEIKPEPKKRATAKK